MGESTFTQAIAYWRKLLVAALAWNTAIQNLFDKVFGKAGAALAGQFLYAILITLVVIFATIAVSRAAERPKRPKPSGTAAPKTGMRTVKRS